MTSDRQHSVIQGAQTFWDSQIARNVDLLLRSASQCDFSFFVLSSGFYKLFFLFFIFCTYLISIIHNVGSSQEQGTAFITETGRYKEELSAATAKEVFTNCFQHSVHTSFQEVNYDLKKRQQFQLNLHNVRRLK